jgi:hypothetical protein
VAGLFEGEGCISLGKPRPGETYQCVSLRLMSTDEDVILSFRDAVNCGHVRKCKLYPTNKQVWEWTVTEKPVVYKLLLQMRHHLHSRRAAKCDEALEVLMKDKRVVQIYS